MRIGILGLAAACSAFFQAFPALAQAQVEAHDGLAGATDHATTEFNRKNRLQASIGMGSAVGEIGASYTYAPLPVVEFEFGLGLGFTGFQFSAMPKLSLAMNRSDRLILGVGPSASLDFATNPNRNYLGYWLNAETGYEHRTVSGFSILLAVGITYGLGGDMRGHCGLDCGGEAHVGSDPVAGKMYPQARLALGRWF